MHICGLREDGRVGGIPGDEGARVRERQPQARPGGAYHFIFPTALVLVFTSKTRIRHHQIHRRRTLRRTRRRRILPFRHPHRCLQGRPEAARPPCHPSAEAPCLPCLRDGACPYCWNRSPHNLSNSLAVDTRTAVQNNACPKTGDCRIVAASAAVATHTLCQLLCAMSLKDILTKSICCLFRSLCCSIECAAFSFSLLKSPCLCFGGGTPTGVAARPLNECRRGNESYEGGKPSDASEPKLLEPLTLWRRSGCSLRYTSSS